MKTSCWIRGCAAGALLLGSGCAMFRASTKEVDVTQTRHMRSTYDYTDLRQLSDAVVSELLGSAFLARQTEPPVMMIAGVQNRTERHEDMKNLTDRIRNQVFQSGKIRFVNEARRDDLLKEQGYSAANATPETQVAIGRQLGARFMLTGSLTEMAQTSPRQVRVSKQKVNYYKLTVEVTDVENAEIVWMTEREFAREASQPLIGW